MELVGRRDINSFLFYEGHAEEHVDNVVYALANRLGMDSSATFVSTTS